MRIKKGIILFVAVIACLGVTNIGIFSATAEPILGDINNDGKVDYKDFEIISNMIANKDTNNSQYKDKADINKNGVVDNEDRKKLLAIIKEVYLSKIVNDKEWNFDNCDTGTIYEYDGLEMVPAALATDAQVAIEERGTKWYNGASFNKAVYLASEGDKGKKAIKFKIDKPCVVMFYAYSGSGNGSVATVSSDSGVINSINIPTGNLVKCVGFLPQAGTYYIHSSLKSIGVSYIKVSPYIKGDIDGDGKCSYPDLNMVDHYLAGSATLDAWQIQSADLDNNGTVNQNDRILLLNLIKTFPENMNNYFSNKVWNISDMLTGALPQRISVDGLTIIPPPDNNSSLYVSEEGPKYYDGMEFIKFINTGGSALLYNYVPKDRALKIDTSAACNLTVLVRSENATVKSHDVCVSRNGELIKQTNILHPNQQSSSQLQRVDVYLPEPDTYYIYGGQSGIKVYYIKIATNQVDNTEYKKTKTFKIAKDKQNEILLKVDNVSSNAQKIYKIVYNKDQIKPKSLGLTGVSSNRQPGDIICSDGILIQSYTPGTITFVLWGDRWDWFGAVAKFGFEELVDGETTLEFIG